MPPTTAGIPLPELSQRDGAFVAPRMRSAYATVTGAGNTALGAAIIVASGLLGFWQEYRAANAVAAPFANLPPDAADAVPPIIARITPAVVDVPLGPNDDTKLEIPALRNALPKLCPCNAAKVPCVTPWARLLSVVAIRKPLGFCWN